MNIYPTITLGLAIAGFLGGIIAAVARLAIRTGRLMERVETNERRDDEERAKNSGKFTELFNRISATECEVKAQATISANLVATCSRIETKLDRIIEREVAK